MNVAFSTSNFEVIGAWGRTWFLALGLALVSLAALEFHWRSLGFAPAVRDSAALWSEHRSRASGMERPGSVVVGASQSQFGIHPPAFAEKTGWPEPIMLSMQGRSPLPILADLAADPSFAGLVIVGVNERILFQESRRRELRAKRRLQESRDLAAQPTTDLETRMTAALDGRFALRSLEVAPDRLLALWRAGFSREPRERRTLPDRSAQLDFRRGDAEAMEKRWIRRLVKEKSPTTKQRDETIEAVREAVAGIRARGGEVVLVRMPSGGRLAHMEERKFPRAQFWEPLVAGSGAVGLHFRDYPSLAAIPVPDGSHIDVVDAPAFTRALAGLVSERVEGDSPGVLP